MQRLTLSLWLAVTVALFLPLSGCSSGQAEHYDVVPVSGVITCQGKPVANATVNFTPQGSDAAAEGRPGRVALGITDKDGRFQLTTYENNDGAIVGKHLVTVGLNRDEDTQADNSASFPCRDASQEVTVEPGMKEIKVEL